MVLVGVDAFVLHEAHHVQGFMVVEAVINASGKRGGFKQRAVFDGIFQAFEFLDDNSARPHIEVSYFGRPHISGRQAYLFAGGFNLGMRIFGQVFGHIRRFGVGDRIVRAGFGVPPAVSNN